MSLNIISDPQVVVFCFARCHFQEGLHFTSRCVVVIDWEREKGVEKERKGKKTRLGVQNSWPNSLSSWDSRS